MQDPDAQHVDAISGALDRVPALHARLETARPESGSLATSDAAHRLGKLVWRRALGGASVAVDHLDTWRTLFGDRDRHHISHVHSHFTLLRAAAEGAVLSRWLCDPKLTLEERRQRAIRDQYADDLERVKFEELSRLDRIPGTPEPEAEGSGVSRLEELRRAAHEVGEKLADPWVVTDQFRDYGRLGPKTHAGQSLYKLLSGLAHGSDWTRLAVSSHQTYEHLEGGQMRVRAIVDLPRTALLTEAVVRLAELAFDDLERYGRGPATQPGRPSGLRH